MNNQPDVEITKANLWVSALLFLAVVLIVFVRSQQ